MLKVPIVLLVFNRPEVVARVFKEIREIQPQILFIVADGPRNELEKSLCGQARAVTEQIDWDCEVYRNYSESNLGCRKRVSSGITWAFEQVDEAIILEDDCIPHPSFFDYCQTLLDYYRNDERIMSISGDNFQNGQWRGDGSYYFSHYPHCWGWATWKRAWQKYDDDLALWEPLKASGLLSSLFNNPAEARYWTSTFDQLMMTGKPDSWAYRWAYSCWTNSGLTVLPNINLVSNIGFGTDSTHTRQKTHAQANLPTSSILEIKHPSFVVRDIFADNYTFKTVFGGYSGVKTQALKGKLARAIAAIKQLANFF